MEPQVNDIKRSASVPLVAQSEADGLSSSNTKKPRVLQPHSTKLSTSMPPDRAASILEMLDADCWRLVLDHVPIADIVRSERVSHAWQLVVRDYLAGVHKYQIVHYNLNTCFSLWRTRVMDLARRKYRIVQIKKKKFFVNMIQKMGPFCVSLFAHFVDKEYLEAIVANCPNLKKLKMLLFVDSPEETLHLEILNKCKLTQIAVDLLKQGDDSSLIDIATMESLEDLVIMNHQLTGSFLTNLRANLKTLIFFDCKALLIKHIRSVADRLIGLTRLDLSDNSISTLQDTPLLLDVTPNLERLGLEYYQHRGRLYEKLIEMGNEVPTAIAGLSRLRELRLWTNNAVTDKWLAIVARGCPALRSIDVGRTFVSPGGLRALCRARPELVELVVCSPSVTDEDLEACARYCKRLELLDVSYSHGLTTSLPERLSWPRARPLRLRLFDVWKEKLEINYDGVTLLWDIFSHMPWPE